LGPFLQQVKLHLPNRNKDCPCLNVAVTAERLEHDTSSNQLPTQPEKKHCSTTQHQVTKI
jgi:hypothetical protein